jgi:PIN domain nuclease of toxin-antitoxin system
MRLLVDTQSLIWYVDQDHLLSVAAHETMTDPTNDLLVSAGTLWEIAIKAGLKKLTLSMPYRRWMSQVITDLGLVILPITIEYADAQAGLPRYHRDPFGRLLIAQAMVEQIPTVSADPAFDAYSVKRIW